MSTITFIEQMVEAMYTGHIYSVIDCLKSLGRESMQSSDDSPFQNVWEEFASQVQGFESVFWDLYISIIKDQLYYIVENLPSTELKLLWYYSDKGKEWVWSIEWDREHCVQYEANKEETFAIDDIVETAYNRIYTIASNTELPEEISDLDLGDDF